MSADTIVEPARMLPIADRADVIVAGGGPAGVAAAAAAARSGARTILVERAPFLGGSATGALVASFMGFFWRQTRVTGGIGYDIVQRLIAAGGGTDFAGYVLAEASDTPLEIRSFPFEPEILKVVLDDLLRDAGVKVLLHTQAVEPVMDGDRVAGLIVQGRSDRKALLAKVVIDAGADGLIARKAGAATQNAGEDHRGRMPMTLMARLTDVDVAAYKAVPRAEKQRLSRLGMASGELMVRNLSIKNPPGAGAGEVIVHMTRVSGCDGSEEEDLTRAEMEGRRQMMAVLPFLRREVPGFARCRLTAFAPWIGVRETYRIVGDHVLTLDDIMSGRTFRDTIAQGGGPLDVHHVDGGGFTLTEPPAPFAIPYRCLVPQGIDGLLAAGRCASATGDAMGAIRHMGTGMAMGHAAGTAAAIAARSNTNVRDIDTDALRDALRAQGAIVDPPITNAVPAACEP
jgi:hypothetical protein